MVEKRNSTVKIIVTVLLFILVCLGVYLLYSKIINKDETNEVSENTKNGIYENNVMYTVTQDETVKLSDYIDTENIKYAVFMSSDVMSIDNEYTITGKAIGTDTLEVTYNDDTVKYYQFESVENYKIKMVVGEEINLSEYISVDEASNVEVSDTTLFILQDNKITALSEGETTLTVTYSDGSIQIYTLVASVETSNISPSLNGLEDACLVSINVLNSRIEDIVFKNWYLGVDEDYYPYFTNETYTLSYSTSNLTMNFNVHHYEHGGVYLSGISEVKEEIIEGFHVFKEKGKFLQFQAKVKGRPGIGRMSVPVGSKSGSIDMTKYSFMGWYTKPNGKGIKLSDSFGRELTSDAVWSTLCDRTIYAYMKPRSSSNSYKGY